MEYFVLGTLVEKAKAAGFSILKGQYLPTAKNDMVKHHYQSMGFQEQKEYWLLAVQEAKVPVTFIARK
jgi:predicted enzyme involved in methoxymalonyl-ACP biosynthesis